MSPLRQRFSALVRLAIALVSLGLMAGAVAFVLDWLARNPQHDPRAPLVISQPEGWATGGKLANLRVDGAECRAVLERSGIAFETLPPTGEGECRRTDRTLPEQDRQRGLAYSPEQADATCAIHAALAWWLDHRVQPAAHEILGSRVERFVHLGTASCRRINNGPAGAWSEHASGNAIDISAFELADGRIISVQRDWKGDSAAAVFLRKVRDGACDAFGTTLSPEYNVLHHDHFHFDQADRGRATYCG